MAKYDDMTDAELDAEKARLDASAAKKAAILDAKLNEVADNLAKLECTIEAKEKREGKDK